MIGQVRVLLLEVPRLLRDLLEHAIGADRECELMSHSGADTRILDQPSPDVVILGLTAEQDTALVAALFARWPRTQILTVSHDGDDTTVYELTPRRRALGQMGPDEMVRVVRDAVGRNRHQRQQDNGARAV